jgi:hypothetical protein
MIVLLKKVWFIIVVQNNNNKDIYIKRVSDVKFFSFYGEQHKWKKYLNYHIKLL